MQSELWFEVHKSLCLIRYSTFVMAAQEISLDRKDDPIVIPSLKARKPKEWFEFAVTGMEKTADYTHVSYGFS